MNLKFKSIVKISLISVLNITLISVFTACGSDTSKESSLSGGKCIDLPFDIPYKKQVWKVTADNHVSRMTSEILEQSKKSTTTKISINILDGTPTVASKFKQNYYIKGNYKYVTDGVGTRVDGRDSSISEYDPYFRSPYKRICEGQSWTDRFDTHTTSSDGKENTWSSIFEWTIEDINVKKSIGIGDFNTYLTVFRSFDSDGNIDNVDKFWIDRDSFMTVYREQYKGEKTLMTISELIEYSK